MKEVKIIQSDDGSISVESDGQEPQLFADVGEAFEFVQNQFGMKEVEDESNTGEPEAEPVNEAGPISASKGKTLEDNIPIVNKKKKGMMPETRADWSDYSMQ